MLGSALGVVGLMNVQYALKDNEIYILEVNPRASRTVPFVSKATGRPLASIAALCMVGKTLKEQNITEEISPKFYSVKEAILPFLKFPGVDPILGPEMRSTGEVMGIDRDFAIAFAKSQIGAGQTLPQSGRVFVSVRDQDKARILPAISELIDMGFAVVATRGTKRYLEENGLESEVVNKVLEGRPHIVDAMKNGEIDLVFNTTEGAKALIDSKDIRRTALLHRIPYYTTVAGALAVTRAIRALRDHILRVAPLQSYAKASGTV